MIAVADFAHRRLADDRARAPAQALRLIVVDDHPAVRRGLQGLLEDQIDFRVIRAVSSAEEAISVSKQHRIDVAVIDYQLGARNGLWLTRRLKRAPNPPGALIYSAYCDGLLSAAAVVAEADALVSKGALGSELCDAIRDVADGRRRLPIMPAYVAQLMRRRLDEQEQTIFGMLVAGIPFAEIAEMLSLSSVALESRLGEMLTKLETLDKDPARLKGTPAAIG
jgi:DNA-binding NarL/FixJ family response regulator